MLISSSNDSTKDAVFTVLDAKYVVVYNCCHEFVFLSEMY